MKEILDAVLANPAAGSVVVLLLLAQAIVSLAKNAPALVRAIRGSGEGGAIPRIGNASVEEGKNIGREIVATAMAGHEKVAAERSDDATVLLRDIRADIGGGIEILRERLHNLASPITSAALRMEAAAGRLEVAAGRLEVAAGKLENAALRIEGGK